MKNAKTLVKIEMLGPGLNARHRGLSPSIHKFGNELIASGLRLGFPVLAKYVQTGERHWGEACLAMLKDYHRGLEAEVQAKGWVEQFAEPPAFLPVYRKHLIAGREAQVRRVGKGSAGGEDFELGPVDEQADFQAAIGIRFEGFTLFRAKPAHFFLELAREFSVIYSKALRLKCRCIVLPQIQHKRRRDGIIDHWNKQPSARIPTEGPTF